jgi:FtsP/CotA-like multicopper oxidase with cupredoxin domain
MKDKGFCIKGMMAALALAIVFLLPSSSHARVVEYDLTVGYKTVNYTGKQRKAMAINGRIPGPTLTFTEGDRAIIRVHNDMDVETSIHWHGILVPNQYDGVPYVTTMPILPGKTHTFTFDLRQTGTYWYHSHTNLQEQMGMYGAIVIHPKEPKVKVDRDIVLVLSDWTDENPYEVLRTLKRGSEWYSIKKGTAQSWDRVILHHAVKERLKQSYERMPPMDLSDVYYDRFLVNGRPSLELKDLRPGSRVRLRVINGSTATYFQLQYAGGPLTIISADGQPVEPVTVDRVPMAVAETYDFLLTVPEDGSHELRATAQDASGFSSTYVGPGKKVAAPPMPRPDLFKMFSSTMSGMDHEKQEGMGMMDMGMKMAKKGGEMQKTGEASLLTYGMLRATHSTRLPDNHPTREVRLELTGNMDRYIWSFNNKTLSEADKILIRKGENVRFVLVNKTMMHHPMHLHGHFFRVLNGQGDYAPLKHTVDVAPMKTTTIEFEANEEKDWFFHCHILYHLAAGMARVVHYEGSEIDPSLALAKKKDTFELDDDHFFVWGDTSVMTHMNDGNILISNIRNGLELNWDWDWSHAYEIKPAYVRYVNRLFQVYGGGDFSDEESRGVLGVRYLLPFYVESDLRVNDEGHLRLELWSHIQVFPRLFFRWSANTDGQRRYGLEYLITKRFSAVGNYDSDYGAGLGIKILF